MRLGLGMVTSDAGTTLWLDDWARAEMKSRKTIILVLEYIFANQEQTSKPKSEIVRDHLLSILSYIKACRVRTFEIWLNLGLCWVCFCEVVWGTKTGGLQSFHREAEGALTNKWQGGKPHGIFWKMCPPWKNMEMCLCLECPQDIWDFRLLFLMILSTNLWSWNGKTGHPSKSFSSCLMGAMAASTVFLVATRPSFKSSKVKSTWAYQEQLVRVLGL